MFSCFVCLCLLWDIAIMTCERVYFFDILHVGTRRWGFLYFRPFLYPIMDSPLDPSSLWRQLSLWEIVGLLRYLVEHYIFCKRKKNSREIGRGHFAMYWSTRALARRRLTKMLSIQNCTNANRAKQMTKMTLSRAWVSWRYMIHFEHHSFPMLKKPLDSFNANSRDYRPSCRSAKRI